MLLTHFYFGFGVGESVVVIHVKAFLFSSTDSA